MSTPQTLLVTGAAGFIGSSFVRQKVALGALVNFAAESYVDRSIDSPSAFIETNIQGVFVLLNAYPR